VGIPGARPDRRILAVNALAQTRARTAGQPGQLLPAQPRHPPPRGRRQSGLGRIQPGPARAEKLPESRVSYHRSSRPAITPTTSWACSIFLHIEGIGWHRDGARPGRGEELIRFGPTDFTAVARSFGLRGIRVEQPGEIAPALREALAAEEAVVVDVVTDLEPRAPEPWAPPARQ